MLLHYNMIAIAAPPLFRREKTNFQQNLHTFTNTSEPQAFTRGFRGVCLSENLHSTYTQPTPRYFLGVSQQNVASLPKKSCEEIWCFQILFVTLQTHSEGMLIFIGYEQDGCLAINDRKAPGRKDTAPSNGNSLKMKNTNLLLTYLLCKIQ